MRESLALGSQGSFPRRGYASGFREAVRRVLRTVRTIIGAPDYDRYVSHMKAHHPTCQVVSRDEFMQQRLESRYSRPGARCC